MGDIDLDELTISTAQDGFRKGFFTCKNLTGAYLARIVAIDKNGPKLSATMAISETALSEAEELDAYFKETSRFKGPLHGIPILVKDQADTKGIVTTYSTIIAKDNVPDEDATVVKKLKDAGAIIIGKTTMSEWASTWFSASTATDFTFTHNPYKLGYDVGGSSSGTGSAIAANLALLGVGEDTGGSIRIPSFFCNLVGLRPTVGLVSRTGFMPLIKTQDTPGPMTRTVTDCAIMLDSMVGFDPKDEWTAASVTAGKPVGGSYASNLNSETINKARLGVVRSLFGSKEDPYRRAVNSVINNAFKKLEAAGTTFVDIEIPNLQHYLQFTMYISRSRSDINSFLATKPHLPSDIASIVPAEPLHPTFNFTSTIAHSFTSPEQDPEYLQRILDREEFQRRVVGLFATHNLDALTFPDCQIPAPKHADATNGRFPGLWDFPVNTLLASQARLPAISVPAGFTEDEGLPVGIELVGWQFSEQKLLGLAKGVEDVLQARRAPKIPLTAS